MKNASDIGTMVDDGQSINQSINQSTKKKKQQQQQQQQTAANKKEEMKMGARV